MTRNLENFCKQLKKNFRPSSEQDFSKPVRCWSEKDIIDNEVVDAFVIIFETRGCSWAFKSGCSMCGYFNDSAWRKITEKQLLQQYQNAMKKYNGEKFVKIFTSGSFLDEKEISKKVRKKIITDLSQKTEKISVESRPEYITSEVLSDIKNIEDLNRFEIGVGLETADDSIREKCINKGFTYQDYKKSVEKIKKYGFDLKTYVLIKPPFITEEQCIQDAVGTVEKIKNFTDTISFNPVNVQRNTVVDFLWRRNQYRPPWLWSIIQILRESKKTVDENVLLKCDVVGGGKRRGAHNDGNCDQKILEAIADFSLSQNIEVFENIDCGCREKWFSQLEIEPLSFGSIIDIK
ncbi:MAG: archaeosine biosynthesis radical SAM protein RaSEA [Candidatus Thermoplasmatota archaeon]